MTRGSTPTITMKLPSSVELGSITSASFAMEQSGKRIIRKYLSNMTLDSSENTILVTLTQVDTLSFSENVKAFAQLKVKLTDGTVLISNKFPIVVTGVIDEVAL